jgi:multidrug efflux pump subunit AcrB
VKVWLRYDEEDRSSIRDLEELRILSPQGNRIPLKELADLSLERGVISINHLDSKREIKVEADLSNPSESAPDIISSIREEFIEAELLPRHPTVSTLYEGQNREAMKTASSAKKVMPFIFVSMILVITFTFRSFFQTIVVFLLIPLTLTGVAWGHYVHGMPMSIFSFLGIIALIGILVNDSLVLVSKFNTNLKEGMSVDEAIMTAGLSRFRAIFLTSATTIAGLAPLILEKSFQAQFLVPMAISVAYGIGFATLLTLITLPILLSYLNSFRRIWNWLLSGVYAEPEMVETAIAEMKDENEEI